MDGEMSRRTETGLRARAVGAQPEPHHQKMMGAPRAIHPAARAATPVPRRRKVRCVIARTPSPAARATTHARGERIAQERPQLGRVIHRFTAIEKFEP